MYRFDSQKIHENGFPQYYDGKLFVYDIYRGWAKSISLTPDNDQHISIDPFLPSKNFLGTIDMKFAQDGRLYTLEFNPNGYGKLYRIDYFADAIKTPLAKFTMNTDNGSLPLTVNFSSAESKDLNLGGQIIAYEWDFDNNGSVDSTDANPTFVYTADGVLTAKLTVYNQFGKQSSLSRKIYPGNTRPVINVVRPLEGSFYDQGMTVNYQVNVNDPDESIVQNNIQVLPALGHDLHSHDFSLARGPTGSFQTLLTSGHSDGSNLYYLLKTRYVDKGKGRTPALRGAKVIKLNPRKMEAEFYNEQSGLSVEDIKQGGQVIDRNLGNIVEGSWFSFNPVNLSDVKNIRFRVSSATAGGIVEARFDSPIGQLLGIASMGGSGDWFNYIFIDMPINVAHNNPRKVYFVFKNHNGQEGFIMNVESLEFLKGQ